MSETAREVRLSGERVFEGRLVKLDVDRVRRSDGQESIREVIRHPGAAVILPLLEDGRIVFVRQFRYATGEVMLELPAGKLDSGEEPQRCALRELAEETGFEALEVHDLGSYFTTPGFTDELLYCFVATRLRSGGGGRGEPEEEIDVVTLDHEEALEAARTGAIRDAKTLATLYLGLLRGWLKAPRVDGAGGG